MEKRSFFCSIQNAIQMRMHLFPAMTIALMLVGLPLATVLLLKGGETIGQWKYRNGNTCSCVENSNPKFEFQPDVEMVETGNPMRTFSAHGCAASVFVKFGAYRAGNRTFGIAGLASKPLHAFSNPGFQCHWIPAESPDYPVEGHATKDLPDLGYGRVYSMVVVNCTFEIDVGTNATGGELILIAHHGDGYGSAAERISALTETPGEYDASVFNPPWPYDYVFCGSPVYGNLNPQRIREWISYHAYLYGPRSHFKFYDAGGLHEGVMKILEPWIRVNRVSIENVRSQSQYDGYYYNQYLMINDCLLRTKFLANWTFFFDVDEYLHIEPPNTLDTLLAPYADNCQVLFFQYRMAPDMCSSLKETAAGKWGFEKLTYRHLTSTNHDYKYATNSRLAFSVGVHGAHKSEGNWTALNSTLARYYHFHGTINVHGELCKKYLNGEERGNISIGNDWYSLDHTLVRYEAFAKQAELDILRLAKSYNADGLSKAPSS